MLQEVTDKKLLLGIYDCMFKAIMLDKQNIDYLREIIHCVTNIPKKYLQNITVINSEHIIENKKDKKMRSDIIVDIRNKVINLEMNKTYYEGVFAKNNAYLQKISTNLYNESEDYLETKNVIQINFDNFSYFKNNQEIYKFIYKEESSNIELPENPIKYHIDLAYIQKVCYNKPVINLSKFERYCLLLIASTKKYADEIAGDDIVMKKVSNKLTTLSSDEKMIGLYNAEIEDEKILKTRLHGAEKKGIQKRNIEIAKNMLNKNIDLETISECTGLKIKDIENLIDK